MQLFWRRPRPERESPHRGLFIGADVPRRAGLLGVVILAAATVAVVVHATGALAELELDSVDARFSLRGAELPSRNVVVVTLDGRVPADRLVERLHASGARLVVLDLPSAFAGMRAQTPAIRRYGKVLIGVRGSMPHRLAAAGATFAYAGFPSDDDGAVRREYYSFDGMTSLAVAAARALGRPVGRDHLRGDGTGWIDFPGGPGTIPTLTAADVLAGRAPSRAVRQKVVVVGVSDPRIEPGLATATATRSQPMARPELQAAAVATAISGFPLRGLSGRLGFPLILLLAIVPPILNLQLRPVASLCVSVLVGLLFIVAAQLAFAAGAIVPVVSPLLALVLSTGGALCVRYLDEALGRREARLTFARFVPPPVVEQALAAPRKASHLGGVRRDATVMFTDLREFTTFAEKREPEQVIEILNRYLTGMSDTIRAHGGTVVSYIGDGIMAVFGAPVACSDHADLAIAATREMLERFREFNNWLGSAKQVGPMRIGIGVNSGPVISGNVGSEQRLEYTAIGDTTNTAARLQAMTKGTPHQVFIAESTRQALTGHLDGLTYVDELAIRGREVKVKIWTVGEAQ